MIYYAILCYYIIIVARQYKGLQDRVTWESLLAAGVLDQAVPCTPCLISSINGTALHMSLCFHHIHAP